MSDDRAPRQGGFSVDPEDHEETPLMHDHDRDAEGSANGAQATPKKSFADRINDMADEPLTPLTKVLLVLVLLFLLLTSVFIGLFAGAQHKLKKGGGSKEPVVITSTVEATATATATFTATATVPGKPAPTGEPNKPLCTSSECVVAAASILDGLDISQDPCEDFYQFANGGWFTKNEIPPGKGSFASFDKLSQENKRIIRRIMESNDTNGDPASFDYLTLKKLRGLYTSCMNEDLLNERGDEPLLEVVNIVKSLYRSESWMSSVLGPGSGNAQSMRNGLTAAISFLHSRGIGGLFTFDIDGDVGRDPNEMSLWFSQPDLGLPSKEYYEEEDIRNLYTHTLAQIIITVDDVKSQSPSNSDSTTEVQDTEETQRLWPPWPWPPWGDDGDDDDGKKKEPFNKTAHAIRLAKRVVKFERMIANASLDLEDLYQDPIGTYNPTQFAEFASKLPQINFPMYISTFTPRSFPSTVIVTSTTYAASLSSILDATDTEIVEAYLVTRAALALGPYLGMESAIWKAQRTLVESLQGIKKGQVPDRADWCVQLVENTMGFAAGRYFVQETFGGDSKEKGTKVITDTIDAFKKSLKTLEWMDRESADAASEKADAIRVKVGYPLSPDTTSDWDIYRYYALVTIDKETLLENVLASWVSDGSKKWTKLGRRRDPEAWEMYPSMVNAYFNPPANEIVFPAGILRPPFFSKDWPSYLQYGAFGQVAAHELTHAFDSAGRLYNQQGKLEQWWTNATSEAFNEKQQCLAKQYSKYTVDDGKGGKVHVNGNLTSGENIGDTGLIQAYRAWKGQYHTSLEKGGESLLPGLEYTQEQLFFIAFGQIWAQTIKPQAAVQRVRTDPHSPNKYRVEGTLYNIPEFAAAFNCKAGTKLNPPAEQRCLLWSN